MSELGELPLSLSLTFAEEKREGKSGQDMWKLGIGYSDTILPIG